MKAKKLYTNRHFGEFTLAFNDFVAGVGEFDTDHQAFYPLIGVLCIYKWMWMVDEKLLARFMSTTTDKIEKYFERAEGWRLCNTIPPEYAPVLDQLGQTHAKFWRCAVYTGSDDRFAWSGNTAR
jgi:hypothetical protein